MFELYPHQVEHVNTILDIFSEDSFAMDMSMLGAGKTYTATRVAEVLDFKHVIVVAPVSVKSKWTMMKNEHGLKLDACLSFSELRAAKCKQPKHGLLTRRDYKQTMIIDNITVEIDKVEFNPTPKLLEWTQEGLLLIIDEIQNIKNLSSQFHACRGLITAVNMSHNEQGPPKFPNKTTKSKTLLVSGSPIDKKEQVVHLFRCLGIMTDSNLVQYNIHDQSFTNRGFGQIEDYICKIALPKRVTRMRSTPMHQNNATVCMQRVYQLFQRYFKAERSCAMTPPPPSYEIRKMNGYFEIENEDDARLLRQGTQNLSSASNFDPETGTVTYGAQRIMIAITMALMMIETAKISTFARLARETLSQDPRKKVVIAVNYTATMGDLENLLKEFQPLMLSGSTTAERRGRIVGDFQKPPVQGNRLLIANLSVCSTGIDLDDKVGDSPRVVYVSPMYNTITLYQLSHRFLRMDTKSSSELYMVYGKPAPENLILDALGRKSQVMKETTSQQVDAGVVFPGDFDQYEE